jgi:hypothetical protein
MAVTEQDVIAALPNFPHATRQFIVRKIRALDAAEGKPTANVREEPLPDDWLLDGIIVTLRQRHMLLHQPTMRQLKGLRTWRSFCEKSEAVRRHVESQLPEPPTRIDRQILGELIARCLARWVERFTPVSLGSMTACAHQSLEALEDQFPGYLAAGKLSWILRAHHIRG